MIIFSFFAMILVGTLLLMLPISSRSRTWTPFSDAIFTAVSASCVTGLVVQDTATYWSLFGQTVLLLLIQIGGLGVVTMALAITIASGKRIGIRARSFLQDAVSAPTVGGIVKLTGFILKITFSTELIGAAVLATAFIPEFGFIKGLWYSLFHSVSAFCNAGFDLMGINGKFSSLTAFQDHPVVVITVSFLVIFGGIGFLVWRDFRDHRLRLKKYRMQSKIVLVMSSLLLVVPAILFFFLEFTEGTFLHRISLSWFQSMTARTAGFNTADLPSMSEAGLFLMIGLMLIGGSPGSTAGGMKTTTFAVLLSNMRSVFRRRDDVVFFLRRIDKESIRNASTIATMYILLFSAGGCLISLIEGLPLLTCLYEAASAVGTVGVTLGITPNVGHISRAILIILMYLGRVGGLTIIFAAVSADKKRLSKYPLEKLTVG